MRSRELFDARRGNHLVFDDSKGAIQAQLKSDHLHSQLSLGNITRVEDTAGRKDARGEGFELRTDGHGVIRAAKGILIMTEARVNAASNEWFDQHIGNGAVIRLFRKNEADSVLSYLDEMTLPVFPNSRPSEAYRKTVQLLEQLDRQKVHDRMVRNDRVISLFQPQ